jgi:hypothetical protein
MKKILALLLSLLVSPALAQTAPTPDPVSIYMASVPLAVTGASARVQLPSASVSAAALTISNDGASDVCIAKGTVTVVATNACLSGASTSTSFLIVAGRTITIFKNSSETYVAAIGAGASTLHIYQSNGPVWIQGTPAGAGGGSVTQGTSPWVTSTNDGGNVTQGATTDAACAGDNTSGCTVEARLQRLGQRITSLITALGTPFQAGASIGNSSFAATQSGIWTVQPGNTANTTAWKVDPSAVTSPVSLAKQGTTTTGFNISTATTTQIIPLSGSTVTYVSFFYMQAGGADNVTVEYGTGSSCGTGTTTIGGTLNFGANGGVVGGAGFAPVLIIPAGQALCFLTSAAQQLSGWVTYVQI